MVHFAKMQATWITWSAFLLVSPVVTTAFLLQHTPSTWEAPYSLRTTGEGVLPCSRRSCRSTQTTLGGRTFGVRHSNTGGTSAKLSMNFDLGDMMRQMLGSAASNGGNSQRRKDVVYDAAIVGYGPAGGVMVSFIPRSAFEVPPVILLCRLRGHQTIINVWVKINLSIAFVACDLKRLKPFEPNLLTSGSCNILLHKC